MLRTAALRPLTRVVLVRRRAGLFLAQVAGRGAMCGAEGAGKARLRGEAGGHSHLHQRHRGVGHQAAGLGQAQLQVVVLRRGVELEPELLLQAARAGAQGLGDLRQRQRLIQRKLPSARWPWP